MANTEIFTKIMLVVFEVANAANIFWQKKIMLKDLKSNKNCMHLFAFC